MNWDAIGAVGEMIGALAVVVTLVYLALQVRASTKESDANHLSVSSGQFMDVRSRFMERADVWIKGNAGGELNASELYVFDELVALKNQLHYHSFSRHVVRSTGRERIQVAEMARFLNQYPAAYRSWRSRQESVQLARRRLGVSADDNDAWDRAVDEAVAALEAMEEPAAA
jgi:hypothetical protein